VFRRNFEVCPLEGSKVRKSRNLTPHISEPEVVKRSQKISLGRLKCAQLKSFGPTSRDQSPAHNKIRRENPLFSNFGDPKDHWNSACQNIALLIKLSITDTGEVEIKFFYLQNFDFTSGLFVMDFLN